MELLSKFRIVLIKFYRQTLLLRYNDILCGNPTSISAVNSTVYFVIFVHIVKALSNEDMEIKELASECCLGSRS